MLGADSPQKLRRQSIERWADWEVGHGLSVGGDENAIDAAEESEEWLRVMRFDALSGAGLMMVVGRQDAE